MGVVCCFYGGGGGGKAAESVGSVVVAADMHMRARTDAESFLVRRSSELSFLFRQQLRCTQQRRKKYKKYIVHVSVLKSPDLFAFHTNSAWAIFRFSHDIRKYGKYMGHGLDFGLLFNQPVFPEITPG